MKKDCRESDPSDGVAAGEFSAWLQGIEASLQSGLSSADVPCGSCRGCCRSSMFIHIGPGETRTLRRVPRALLFPAPGLPKGNVLLGYNDKGECPMLQNGECSIYEDRPQTCRDYDCRVFAATGVQVDEQAQPEIARRVSEWVFTYDGEQSRKQHEIVQQAARFLKKNADLFPPGVLPRHPAQLAALAVEIHRLFAKLVTTSSKDATATSDAAIADAIVAALRAAETHSAPARGKAQS